MGAQIFASPLRYDENWNPQPCLAKTGKISADGLSITLDLVQNAVFHDGHPITSEDVAFSIMVVKQYHPFKSMLEPVDRVDTPDRHTAVIRLAHPHPAILLAMSPAFMPILPKHICGDGQDIATHPANLAPVGSGPFKLVRYVPGKTIVLERHDDYFIPGRPYLDELIFRIQSDPDIQMIDLEQQEAHLTSNFGEIAGLDRIQSAVTSGSSVIKSLSDLTRMRDLKVERINLLQLVSSSLHRCNPPAGITLIKNYPKTDLFPGSWNY